MWFKMSLKNLILLLLVWANMSAAQTWQNLNPFEQPPGNAILGLDCVDDECGWAVGEYGFILHTSDGGSTWGQQHPGAADLRLASVDFLDRQNGWVCGDSGLVLHTTDGGETWHRESTGASQNLCGVCFVSARSGWAVGHAAVTLHTTNGGDTWEEQPCPVDRCALLDACFVDSSRGWIVRSSWAVGGGGIILRTTDGGMTWNEQEGHTYLQFAVEAHGRGSHFET